ncbi:MAG: hypothetical protein U1A78_31940 [Polyangia bacterium]
MIRPLVCGLLGAAALLGGRADACDRAESPLEAAAVAVAVADVAAVVEVTRTDEGVAAVRLTSVLKGAVRPGDTLSVRARTGHLLERCGGIPLESGKRYVVALWGPSGALTDYQPVDAYGGIRPYSAANEKDLRGALERRHPSSPWGPISSGIAAQLVRDPRAPGVRGDVDLVVVLRNTTDRPQEMVYDSWPLATQSACTLEIVNLATRQPVAARDVPIPKPDIEKYFSQHARRFKIRLAPGEAYTLRLQGVTTAHPGWGYKEELGFTYYPISKPGPHTITATCRNLFGKDSVLRTGALELPL